MAGHGAPNGTVVTECERVGKSRGHSGSRMPAHGPVSAAPRPLSSAWSSATRLQGPESQGLAHGCHFNKLIGAQRGLVLTTVPRGGGPKGGRKDFKQCMATRLAGARGRGGRLPRALGQWQTARLVAQRPGTRETGDGGSGEGLGGRPTAVGAASVAARLEDAHCTGDVERPRAQRSSSGSQPAFVLRHARPCTMGPRMA